MRFPAVIERGTPRPMVPIDLAWECPTCHVVETAEGIALVDTGAPAGILPEIALPAGHVSWDHLTEAPPARMIRGTPDARYWDVVISVMGIPVAERIKVFQGNLPDYPVLGLGDFGRAFRFTLDFGHAPPVFELEPYGGRPSPVDMRDLPILDYAQGQYRLSQDLRRFVTERPTLADPEPTKRLPSPQRPSRAVRRALERQKTKE